jgi:hypothetical protein
MCSGNSPLEMAVLLLEDGIQEEDLPAALAAQAAGWVRCADSDQPFAVAE